MKTLIISLLFQICVLPQSFKTDDRVVIHLDTLKDLNENPHFIIAYPTAVIKWVNRNDSARLDSVCWLWEPQYEYHIATVAAQGSKRAMEFMKNGGIDYKTLQCGNLPRGIYFIAKKDRDSLTVGLYRHRNTFLEKDIVISYLRDSLSRWTENRHPIGAFPAISIKYPFCIQNKIEWRTLEFAVIPYQKGMTYNDSQLNQLPLEVIAAKQRIGHYEGYKLFAVEDESCPLSKRNIYLNVISPDGRIINRDMFMEHIQYKECYSKGDTISFSKKYYRIDSISADMSSVYLTKLSIHVQHKYLPAIVKNKIKPFFNEKQKLMVIDFWGTWCRPCIAGLPDLKALYEKIKTKYKFVSVCFDDDKNFEKAKALFRDKGVLWQQIFDSQKEYGKSITYGQLHISTFPAFLIVNKDGEILYEGIGFENLKSEINKMKN